MVNIDIFSNRVLKNMVIDRNNKEISAKISFFIFDNKNKN